MKIVYSKSIVKDVRKIKNQQLIESIEAVIKDIKQANSLSELSQVAKMKGHPTAYRIRIGEYRMGLYCDNENVVLARFVKRNDIYKVFP